MKKGKVKCKALKEIRKQIADANDIPYVVSQCTYQGDCKGTCPKCEAELKYLERELAIRTGLGKAVAIAGISVGACSALTACSPIDEAAHFLRNLGMEEQTSGATELSGDIAMPTPEPFAEDKEVLPAPEVTPEPEETPAPDEEPEGLPEPEETPAPDEELAGLLEPEETPAPDEILMGEAIIEEAWEGEITPPPGEE